MEVDRAGAADADVGRRRAASRCAAGSPARWPSTATACGPTATTATSRRAPRCGSPGCCATCARDRPLEAYQDEHRQGRLRPAALDRRPHVLSLTRAIEELTRPVDAIKHQAKTVTVGISRSDEGVLDRALVQAVLDAGAGRDVLDLPHAQGARRPRSRPSRGLGYTRVPDRRRHRSPSSTAAGISRDVRAASTATRCSSAPSGASPASARCSSPAAAATAAR